MTYLEQGDTDSRIGTTRPPGAAMTATEQLADREAERHAEGVLRVRMISDLLADSGLGWR
jgi:hypothetical protein